jgi:NAD(P)-dependent dehydrogenase (short-subunit alcohol dehydrogenase family)
MSTTTPLSGRVAIVTGGGTGIALAVATRLASMGAAVAIASRNPDNLAAGRHHIAEATGVDVASVPVNIRDPEAVASMVSQVGETLGPATILVNNAAADFTCRAENLSPNGWKAIQETVLWGPWFCSTAVAPAMFAEGGGVICNILSTVVLSGAAGRAHSAAAKAGLESLTKSLGVEWADRGVRVVGVSPGPVDTPGSREHVWGDDIDRIAAGLPLRRMASADEIASDVGFLCSPDASYVNGEVIVVDGAAWLAFASSGHAPERQPKPQNLKRW